MNVLEQDRCKAEALTEMIRYCIGRISEHTTDAIRSGKKEDFREAQRWSFELRDAQIELDELFLRKEKSDKWKNTRVFGRAYK